MDACIIGHIRGNLINNVFLYSIGPLINAWCMRMEAKNSYFKRVAQIGNFKNLPLSVAKRHQRLLCGFLQGRFFTYDDLESGPCKCNHSLNNIYRGVHYLG